MASLHGLKTEEITPICSIIEEPFTSHEALYILNINIGDYQNGINLGYLDASITLSKARKNPLRAHSFFDMLKYNFTSLAIESGWYSEFDSSFVNEILDDFCELLEFNGDPNPAAWPTMLERIHLLAPQLFKSDPRLTNSRRALGDLSHEASNDLKLAYSTTELKVKAVLALCRASVFTYNL